MKKAKNVDMIVIMTGAVILGHLSFYLTKKIANSVSLPSNMPISKNSLINMSAISAIFAAAYSDEIDTLTQVGVTLASLTVLGDSIKEQLSGAS
jgi:hypothetical protein